MSRRNDVTYIDVGIPTMDEGHRALAGLIEKIGDICVFPATVDCRCDQCSEKNPTQCLDSLSVTGNEIMVRMLEHFHREEDLMKSLPRNGPARSHCVAHRKEHVSFSTRYNRAVARIDARHPVSGIRDLDALLIDWVRIHILEFDQRLAELLKSRS